MRQHRWTGAGSRATRRHAGFGLETAFKLGALVHRSVGSGPPWCRSRAPVSPAQAEERIHVLLAAPESRSLDFKRISGKQSRMYEAVCAFANSEGGVLVIGVGEKPNIE